MDLSLEELLVALADKLWKGSRPLALEERVVDMAAAAANRNRWDLYAVLVPEFERIASAGEDRLARSQI